MPDPYRVLRFEPGQIPAGLRAEHRLKAGVWGELEVVTGALVFVDAEGGKTALAVGDVHRIAPQALHHLESADDAAIIIRFYRQD